jgi:hypothetical protein
VKVKKLFKSERGSVSVFLIIITLAIFMFNAVLIDYARVYAAQKQTEEAAKAGVRSVLSYYDSGLQEYGLYGFGGDGAKANDIFSTVLNQNLSTGHVDGSLQFLDTKVESATASLSRPVSDPLITEHQILEEMKYKAPIEFTRQIIEEFSSVSKAMKEASNFLDYASDLDDLAKARETALDNIEKELMNAHNKLTYSDFSGVVNGSKTTVEDDFNVKNLQDIIEQYDKYKDAYKGQTEESSEGTADEEEAPAEKGDPDDYFNQSSNLIKSLTEINDATKTHLIKAQEELINAIDKNNEMQKVIDKGEEGKGYYDTVAGKSGAGIDTTKVTDGINAAKEKSQSMVYESELDDLTRKLKECINAFEELNEVLKTFQMNYFNTNNKASSMANLAERDLKDSISRDVRIIRESHEKYVKAVKSTLDFLNMSWRMKKAEETEEGAANAEMDKAKEKFDVFGALQGTAEEEAIYKELQAILKTNSEQPQINFDESSKEMGQSSMGFVDDLFSGIANILEGSRNELYVNEYILMRFASIEPLLFTDANSLMENASFKNREVEYVMYGIHEPYVNYSAAITQLTALRFALNFLAAFTQPAILAAGHPIAVLFSALRYAIAETVTDMTTLTDGNAATEVRLLKITGVNVYFDYKEYLRLFLFMNPGKENKLRRITTVIEQRTGSSLAETSSYVTGQVKASVDLWFLPGLTKLLTGSGVLKGDVVKDRYIITKKVNYSY